MCALLEQSADANLNTARGVPMAELDFDFDVLFYVLSAAVLGIVAVRLTLDYARRLAVVKTQRLLKASKTARAAPPQGDDTLGE